MKEYLTISEIGSLFGMSTQTLHYYDRIGLFQPAVRDSGTNYRQYYFDQLYQLASIRYLRKMGCSVKDIQQFLNSRTPERTIDALRRRSQELHDQWDRLIQVDEAIMRKINFIEKKRVNLDTSSIELRWFPQRWYIPIGSEDRLYMKDSFYFYPTVVLYEGDTKYFGAYLDAAADGIPADPNSPVLSAIPAGQYLVGFHQGPYEKIQESFSRIRARYPELQEGEPAVAFNIIDQFVERDNKNYITEIQMPVLESNGS
ncbi:MAG: MerR family transcriptional regulator [Oscillibacter sp.]|jgi:DNA-binding transcriptional MerR regulator/effector-binding domain-containing protein|nr:MerR family transcriptional regulator [Oscillibacter sp.]